MMIDRVNALMELWPKGHFPFPATTREKHGWLLSCTASGKPFTIRHQSILVALRDMAVALSQDRPDATKMFGDFVAACQVQISDIHSLQESSTTLLSGTHQVDGEDHAFFSLNGFFDGFTVREIRQVQQDQKLHNNREVYKRKRILKSLRQNAV
jgi:hypothetical protein